MMIFLPVYLGLMVVGILSQSGWAAEEPPPVANPKIQILDLVFKVEDLAGKMQDLQVKETDLEIRIELAADVLFDFDKADIRPDAQNTLKQAGGIIRDRAKGKVRIQGTTAAHGAAPSNPKV